MYINSREKSAIQTFEPAFVDADVRKKNENVKIQILEFKGSAKYEYLNWNDASYAFECK